MKRRTLLSEVLAVGALLGGTSVTQLAWATRRSQYGGQLRLSLPLNFSQLDPHDPSDLTAGLLGSAVFEPLFGRTAHGQVYPTLAARMPRSIKGRLEVELRPGLEFASGKRLAAQDVVSSIKRSQTHCHALRSIGVPRVHGSQSLSFQTSLEPSELARLLAQAQAAIVPRGFNPRRPDGCGPLAVESTGREMRLTRNIRAPRGGSYVDSAIFRTESLRDCLRAFESHRSDLGFLGRGLHRPRKGSRSFTLAPLGMVTVQSGRGLQQFSRPGLLHSGLAQLPHSPFSALGVHRVRTSPAAWSGPSLSLLVPAEVPWLRSIAEELQKHWSRPGSEIVVSPVPLSTLPVRRKKGDYDLLLDSLVTQGIEMAATTKELFSRDGQSAPQGGRVLTPEQACRRLRTGILGELRPTGGVTPNYPGLINNKRLELGNAHLIRRLDAK